MDKQSGPLPIKDVVNKIISALNVDSEKEERITRERINEAWEKAAGKLAGRMSRPTSLKKGKLVIAVRDSSFLYDLTLRKKAVLESLNMELNGKIQDVQFRIGETGGEEKKRKAKT